ncbi:MAG: YkgJ family cysteine cluster protein [Dehalococcoidia bacterium]|nr:YkgJ family cysteine cluster protein [Dehalococcoidia bacterium]
MTEVLTEAGARSAIPCLRCGDCCRRYQVRLDLAEAERIAAELGLTLDAFRDKYADRRWPGERSLLVRQKDGCCPFLQRSGENGDELCGIHSFKPSSCRDWVPGLNRRECQAGLARRWEVAVDSSGGLKGSDGRMRDFSLFMDSLASDGRI